MRKVIRDSPRNMTNTCYYDLLTFTWQRQALCGQYFVVNFTNSVGHIWNQRSLRQENSGRLWNWKITAVFWKLMKTLNQRDYNCTSAPSEVCNRFPRGVAILKFHHNPKIPLYLWSCHYNKGCQACFVYIFYPNLRDCTSWNIMGSTRLSSFFLQSYKFPSLHHQNCLKQK